MCKPDRIIGMASAFYESSVLFAASDLGVFEGLARLGSADAGVLATELKCDERGTRLLLDACVALELLKKDNSEYSNAPESKAFLVPGSPGDLSGAIRYNRDVYPAWGELASLVKSGRPVERPEIHLGEDMERTRTFVMAMHYRALGIGRAVVPLLDLGECRTVLDVGGGPGTYSILIAQAHSQVTCTVLDLPKIVGIADELIQQQDMQKRVKTLAGDYRTMDFPRGNDAVNFFGVLHQESPESIRALLNKAHNSLNPGGVVNVMDIMTDSTHTRPRFSALFAVNMALTTDSGWVFADSELKEWMEESGLTDCVVKPLPSPMPHCLGTARAKSRK